MPPMSCVQSIGVSNYCSLVPWENLPILFIWVLSDSRAILATGCKRDERIYCPSVYLQKEHHSLLMSTQSMSKTRHGAKEVSSNNS
jgi:hypothetical protein